MTHLSDFSYVDRLAWSIVGLIFILLYAIIGENCFKDLKWEKMKNYNFKSVVVLLFLGSSILLIAADSQAIVIKYELGFYDTCTINCTDFVNGTKSCTFKNENTSDCLGIRTMPRDQFPQWALDLLPSTDACFNIACTFRTSAVFLMIACFNCTMRLIFPQPIMPHLEVKIFSLYSLCSIVAYLGLQFGANDELDSTIYPQILYSAELMLASIFLIVTNIRINNLLETLPRNFQQPSGSESMLLYVKTMNFILSAVLLCTSIGLLAINADLLHNGENGKIFRSKFLTDIFTKMLNVGIAMEPIIVVLIMYKPRMLFTSPALHGSSLSGTGFGAEASLKRSSNGSDSNKSNGFHDVFQKKLYRRNRVLSADEVMMRERLLLQALNSIEEAGGDPKQLDIILPAQRKVRFVLENEEGTDKSSIENRADDRERAWSVTSTDTIDTISSHDGGSEYASKNNMPPTPTSAKIVEIQRIDSSSKDNKSRLHTSSSSERNSLIFGETSSTKRLFKQFSADPNESLCSDGASVTEDQDDADPLSCSLKMSDSNQGFGDAKVTDVELTLPPISSKGLDKSDSQSFRTKSERRYWQMSKSVKSLPSSDSANKETSTMNLTTSERLKLSKLWVSDAIHAREPKFHRIRGRPQLVYKIVFSTSWRNLLKLTCFVQMVVLPFFEPTKTAGVSVDFDKSYVAALWVDLLCVFIFWIDLFLTVYTYGIYQSGLLSIFNGFGIKGLGKNVDTYTLRHASPDEGVEASKKGCGASNLIHAQSFVLVLQLVNVVAALINHNMFRLDRVARPLIVLFISPTVRYLSEDLVRTFSDFFGVFFAYVFLCLYYGLIGSWLFGDSSYISKRDEFYGVFNDSIPGTSPPPEGLFDFSTVPIAWLNMFVLTSVESYPAVMLPAYEFAEVASFLFFGSFIVISIVFLQSIAVPLVYRPFQRRQRERLLRLKLRERKALVAAFEILDVNESEALEHDIMRRLLSSFTSGDHIEVMFQLLDEDKNGTIDLFEFFKIVDTIKLNIKVKTLAEKPPYFRLCGIRSTYFNRNAVIKIVETKAFSYLGTTMCTSALIALLIQDYVKEIVPVWIGIVLFYLVVELLLLDIADEISSRVYMRPWIYISTVVVEVSLYVAYLAVSSFSTSASSGIFKFLCFAVVSMHVGIRIVVRVKTVERIVFVSLKLFHILGLLLLIVLLIVYFYAIIGMEVFSDSAYTTLPNNEGDFSTFPKCMLSVFQLTTGEDWFELLYMQLAEPGGTVVRNTFVAIYFVSFTFITDIYLLSIVLAVFLDAFLVVEKIEDDTIKVIYDNDKAARTLGLPSKKFKLTKVRTLEEILYEDFLQDNQLNTIEELVRMGVIKTEKRETFMRNQSMKMEKRRRSNKAFRSLEPKTPTFRSNDVIEEFELKKLESNSRIDLSNSLFGD